MNKQQFISYLENPGSILQDEIPQLKELVKAYPAFQSGQILLLKSLYSASDVMYQKHLAYVAAYTGNRELLYDLILGKPEKETEKAFVKEEVEPLPTVEPVVSGTPDKEVITEQKTSGYFDAVTVSNDYFNVESKVGPATDEPYQGIHSFSHWLDIMSQSKPQSEHPKAEVKDKQWDLIDNFIREKPSMKNERSEARLKTAPVPDLSEGSVEENEEFITETLARIYISQKHYQKAVQIFKKLSLKYPEKSIYFAGQIKIVEQLIHNEK